MAYEPANSMEEYEERIRAKKEEYRVKLLLFKEALSQSRDLLVNSLLMSLLPSIEREPTTWAPTFIKLVAAQYLRLLTGNQPRQGVEGFNASSSCHYPFLSLMAQEIGMSVKDTAALCGRLISAGDEAAECGSQYIVQVAQAHDKTSLGAHVRQCRMHFESSFSLATQLPDQGALLVHARILDELL